MKKKLIIGLMLSSFINVNAQTNGYTLKQCVDYALNSSPQIKNTQIDQVITDNKAKEVRAKLLPHVEGEADFIHNFNIQKIILENGVIPAFTNPMQPKGEVIAFQLQLQNNMVTSLNASQIIFDKGLFSQLNASSLYDELATENVKKSKVDVVELVSKAYYGVLVTQQQLIFLRNNLARLDSVYNETEARFKAGLIKQIDLYRVEVALNNMKEELEKSEKNLSLSKSVLAFQMNIDNPENIILTDSLNEFSFTETTISSTQMNYNSRIEYSILLTQQKIGLEKTKIAKSAFYPRLSAFATSGFNPSATNASDIFQSSRYYNYTFVGAKLQIPIFSGFDKRFKLKNELLEEEKLKNNIQRTEKIIGLEVQQAQINYSKAIESLKIQKRNLNLAQENLKSIKIENEKGIANNIEVINAETDLRQAQNSYYNSLYQIYIAKIDLDKSLGNLKY